MNEDTSSVYQRKGRMDVSEDSTGIVDSGSSKSLLQENGAVPHSDKRPYEDPFKDRSDVLHSAKEGLLNKNLVNNNSDQIKSNMTEESHTNSTMQNGFQKDHSTGKSERRKRILPQVEFKIRNSLLTDLFEINHIRTIYNIFVVMLLILFLNTAVHDVLETGSTHLGVMTVRQGFGKLFTVIQIWILLTLSTFVTYYGFSIWANNRYKFVPRSVSAKLWDLGFLTAFISNQIAFIVIPGKYIIDENLPPASSLMILMEQVRMLMKTHAFVRSTAPRFLPVDAEKNAYVRTLFPKFSMFLYFMFAPTLVYSDSYPRTEHTKWKTVCWNFFEVIMVIFYVAFIFERFLMPPFEKFGSNIFEPKAVVLTIFSTTLPGLIMFLFGFYCVLHSWQNCTAELLRFGDRLFYKDWWNCTSYDAFYRTWNILVHNWLYVYIYKDVYEKFNNKFVATITTFLVSAIFHEYILALSFRFFYPVMLLMFGGFGMLFVFITKKYSSMDGNIFIWFTLFLGNGILFTLYSMEYYARLNCSASENFLVNLLVPRSWVCDGTVSNNTS